MFHYSDYSVVFVSDIPRAFIYKPRAAGVIFSEHTC